MATSPVGSRRTRTPLIPHPTTRAVVSIGAKANPTPPPTVNQLIPVARRSPGTISQHIICSGQLFAQFFRSHPEELPEAQRGQLQAQQAVRRLILSVPGPELV